MTRRDPVERGAEGTRDLYDVSTWEPRTALDRLAVKVYGAVKVAARVVLVLLGLLILVTQFLLGGIGATIAQDPRALGLVVLSVVPALLLAAYVYVTDITTDEPLELLVGTFVLGVVFAGFAAIVNAAFSFVTLVPVFGVIVFFYVVVGPVEEAVKLLAVRLFPYRDVRFDAVIDGAVYGAVAGLGFATIENALYITRQIAPSGNELLAVVGGGALAASGVGDVIGNIIGPGGQITALRALAGPGHVIYSSFAGYYLGLAKFNREHAGPIAVKGLLIAAFIHGTYNTLVTPVPALAAALTGADPLLMFFGFVVVYDGVFGYILFRKLSRYRATYRAVGAGAVEERRDGEDGDESDIAPERTEFED